MTSEEFTERYRIMSSTGRCYDRAMVLSACARDAIAKTMKLRRAELAAVLDDDAFIRPLAGMVPARVAEVVALEALVRRG